MRVCIRGRYLHDRLDPLHWEHHERPCDGLHISGQLTDLVPIFVVAAPASYVKRFHRYHHTHPGMESVFGTRYPEPVRRALFGPRG